MPVEIVPRTVGPRGYSARPNYPQESQGIYSLLDQDQEVPEGMDPGSRMAVVRDLAVQVFEKMKALGMDTPMTSVDSIFQGLMTDPDAMSQAYEFVAPDFNEGLQNNLRMPSEEMMMQQGISGEQLQAVENLGREAMSPRMSVAELQAVENLGRQATLKPGQTVLGAAGNVIAQEEQSLVTLKPGQLVIDSSGRVVSEEGIAPPSQQLADPNQRYTLDEIRKIMELGRGMGIGEQMMLKPGEMIFPRENAISLPQGRPTMSERLLSQMSLRDE